MGRRLEPRAGLRLNTSNYIKTPSGHIKSADYSSGLKILELEWQDENGDSRVYHYLNVEKEIYRKILKLKKNIDELPERSAKSPENKYSIGKFVSSDIRDVYDYYELHAWDAPA